MKVVNQTLTPEEQKDHLMKMKEEFDAYSELVWEDKQSYYKKEGDVGYVLNMEWAKQWERMVYSSDY